MKTFLKKTWILFDGFVVWLLAYIFLDSINLSYGLELLFALVILVFLSLAFNFIFKTVKRENTELEKSESVAITLLSLLLILIFYVITYFVFVTILDSEIMAYPNYLDIAFIIVAIYVIVLQLIYTKASFAFVNYFTVFGFILFVIGLLESIGVIDLFSSIYIPISLVLIIAGNVFMAIGAAFKLAKNALLNAKERDEKLIEAINNLNQRNID